jgi:hypothetical protein
MHARAWPPHRGAGPGLVTICALMVAGAFPACGNNDSTTLPLHAWAGFAPPELPCYWDVCGAAGPATVHVPLGEQVMVVLYVRNFDAVAGVETAFDFGTWTLNFGLWDCRSNQVNGAVPANPGGPVAGTLATAFDCVTGGATTSLGRMYFLPITESGCLTQVESAQPLGTCVVDCLGNATPVAASNRGRICAGMPGGVDACEPVPVAITTESWGRLKHRLHD